MATSLMLILTASAALVTAMVAGVFLTFSDFVMKGLTTASPPGGMEAMQVINRKVYGSVFLVLLLGMAPVSAGLAAYAYYFVPGGAALWITSGAGLYIVGVVLVTMICNVPMNKQLDGLDIASADGTAYWVEYGADWTGWNHVRTVCSAASALCFLVGCLLIIKV